MLSMRFVSIVFLAFTALASLSTAKAQPVPRVYFYSNPGFQGECLIVDANNAIADLAKIRDSRGRRWDDRIASVRVEGPALAILYADPRFRGERIEIRNAVPDLARLRHGETGIENWDARTTSLKVETRGLPSLPHIYYRSQRDADRDIHRAFAEILGRAPDHAGLQHYRHRLLEDGWNYSDLRNDLLRCDEYRKRDFEGIVTKCYFDILGRGPDANGLRSYARAMRDRGMTEQELRTELRRSDEARKRLADQIVQRAFRDILRREPDAEGYRHYTQLVMGGWTEERVRDDLRRSNEVRKGR